MTMFETTDVDQVSDTSASAVVDAVMRATGILLLMAIGAKHRDLVQAMFKALGSAPNIEYIDMPEAIRDKYQYFTQGHMENLRAAGYTAAFMSLEEAVGRYVTQFLDRTDRYR